MKHDCTCFRGVSDDGIDPPRCRIHVACACGCERRHHDRHGIGECLNWKNAIEGRYQCHGCPEYRPATRKPFTELTDYTLDRLPIEVIRERYRELRAHHIEETTMLSRRPLLHADDDYAMIREDTLRQRGVDIDSVCQVCAGYGTRSYSNTAIWRGGVGGAAITKGVCDNCWGSGDAAYPWTNLRTYEERMREVIAERAVTALVDSCGATFSTSKPSIQEIIDHLDVMIRKRTVGFWTRPLAIGLANILRRAIGVPEKEDK